MKKGNSRPLIIDFQIHQIFLNAFLIPHTPETETRFHSLWNSYSRKFNKSRISLIVDTIEKLSGFKWKVGKIPIYLIPPQAKLKSFAKPHLENNLAGIVLKLYSDEDMFEHILIHELCHINQFQSEFAINSNPYYFQNGEKNFKGMEICADIVTLYVIRTSHGEGSSIERNLWNFLQTGDEVNQEKYKLLKNKDVEWNLNKKPLKEYIRKA